MLYSKKIVDGGTNVLEQSSRKVLVTTASVLLLTFAAGWASAELPRSPHKVGVILPIGEFRAAYGTKIRQGIDLAAEEYAGKVELLYQEVPETPQEALSAYRKLTVLGRAASIISPLGSSQVLAVAPAALAQGKLFMAVSMCMWRYRGYDNLFCSYPSPESRLQPHPAVPAKANPAFVDKFRERYGAAPDLDHALAYDGARYLFEALTMWGKKDYRSVARRLLNLRLEHTANPGFHFDLNRAAVLSTQSQVVQGDSAAAAGQLLSGQ